jgi:hypothetical protein
MRNWLHNLAHRLGLTGGYVDHEKDGHGVGGSASAARTATTYPEDKQFEDVNVSEARPCGAGWDITRADGWSFYVPPESPIEPQAGMTARFYGKGMGYTVRGLFLDGVKVFYRTEAEEKEHFLAQTYGTDAADWLARWDSGRSVWSVEMGGFGPGYEQAIQITAVEVIRILLTEKFDTTRWSDSEAWEADRKTIEDSAFKNPTVDKLGLSGAQWGASISVATAIYRRGPRAALTDPAIKDRLIQVSKSFPQG